MMMMMMMVVVMELVHSDRWKRPEYSLPMLLDFQGFLHNYLLNSKKKKKKNLSLHSIKSSNSALAPLF